LGAVPSAKIIMVIALKFFLRGYSSTGRAPPLQGGGYRFEPD
jgi:hypothetical protein